MARARSPEKRSALLAASVEEIAEAGTGASTANIARRAGLAAGTLFLYFASKEVLLNVLYLELKSEVYARINQDFPVNRSLERRACHVWMSYLAWAAEFPRKRRASVQLHVSDAVTAATRAETLVERRLVDQTMAELDARPALAGLPKGFAAALMSSMQEATLELLAAHPGRRRQLAEQAFAAYWRAVR